MSRVIGNRGGTWRGAVSEHGTLIPADGGCELAWHVAGDDRWYSPGSEPTLRQKWYAGFPVCETRIRVGNGDIVQRMYCVADRGGMTVVEFENESTLPVAIAVTRSDVLTTRKPIDNPPAGIDLPAGSMVIPLGHKSTARIALAHVNPSSGPLPDDVPDHQQVVRGWETACDLASRITMPDHSVVAGIARVRSDLLLGVGVSEDVSIELVRLAETHRDSIVDVVEAVQRRVKAEKRAKVLQWDTPHLMATAARACVLLEDEVAASDIGSTWLRMADRDVAELPIEIPAGLGAIAWAESLLAQGSPSGGQCVLLPHGIPETWWGSAFEAHGITADPYRTISFAVRWHGPRPAVLWEITGAAGLLITGGAADPAWHTTDASGEALLAAPVSTNV